MQRNYFGIILSLYNRIGKVNKNEMLYIAMMQVSNLSM